MRVRISVVPSRGSLIGFDPVFEQFFPLFFSLFFRLVGGRFAGFKTSFVLLVLIITKVERV